eukprot:PITA_08468
MAWKILEMDVNTSFLNGVVEEEIYIKKLEGFETYDEEPHVFKLKRVLYGDEQLIYSSKEYLPREFKMKDMVLMYYFLGFEVWQGYGELFMSRGKYAIEILQIFYIENCKPMDPPVATNWRKEYAFLGEDIDATIYRKLVGWLMHLMNT